MASSIRDPSQLNGAREDAAYRTSLGATFDGAISKYHNLFRALRHRDVGREIRAVLERDRGLYLAPAEEVSLGVAYAAAYAIELERQPSDVLPSVALDAVLRQYWRMIGTPSDHVLQTRRTRQAAYAEKKRAAEPKPETRLTPMEFAALVLLDGSPLSRRERQALVNAFAGVPVDGAEKRARTRMRATLRRTLDSREVLDVLLEELRRRYDQLDRIEQIVSALYQAHLLAPLEDELDSITAEESFAELADMRAVFAPEDVA